MKQIVFRMIVLSSIFLIVSCNDDNFDDDLSASIYIDNFEEITHNSFKAKIRIESGKFDHLKSWGFCFSKNSEMEDPIHVRTMNLLSNTEVLTAHNLDDETKYFVQPFAYDSLGTKTLGKVKNITTLEAPARPKTVDNFKIETERKKWVYDTRYFSSLGQYRLMVKEYTEVTYTWSCTDPTVIGIVTSQNEFSPNDGDRCSSSIYNHYAPNGTEYFGMEDHITGNFTLYIKTYNSSYIYSEKSYKVNVYIAPSTNSEIWRSSPYL